LSFCIYTVDPLFRPIVVPILVPPPNTNEENTLLVAINKALL